MSFWIAGLIQFFMVLGSSRHLLQTLIYNQGKYLTALGDIHSKLKTDVITIRQRLQTFKSELKKVEGNPEARIQLLKRGLSEERESLLKLESFAKIPYGLSACRCSFISQDQKGSVQAKLQMTSGSIQKLKDDMVQWPTCLLSAQLKSQLSRQELYAQQMRDTINSQCHRPPKPFLPDEPTGMININESRYISNLDEAKWIYGSISPGDYKYKMFSLSSKLNLTKCPPQNPFTRTGLQCISCPNHNPIWNVGSTNCTTCAVGEQYNPYGHNCSTKSLRQQQLLAKSKGIGGFGIENNLLPSSYNVNRRGTNYINNPPEEDPDLKTCPDTAPFFNGRSCVSCVLPRVFDFDTRSCESCPSGTTFNVKKKTCSNTYSARSVTNLDAKNLVAGGDRDFDDYTKQQRQKLVRDPQIQICPIQKPYFDGQSCIKCSQDKPYFFLNSQECDYCNPGSTYFQEVHNCTANVYVTNTIAKGILETGNQTVSSIYQNAALLRDKNPNNLIEVCPNQKPFAQQNSCAFCPPQTPLFDLSTSLCTKCPGQTTYDEVTRRCSGLYITNPDTPNLYFKGITKQQYSQNYYITKARNQAIQDCPNEAPFFDGTRCVNCAQSTPIFSVRTRMCGQCPIGRRFDQKLGDCVQTDNQ